MSPTRKERGAFLHVQTKYERQALRLLEDERFQQDEERLAIFWQNLAPSFKQSTYTRLKTSLREIALLVALQVVNGNPLDPGVVEISCGPHRWNNQSVPGGRWGINNPDTLYFAIPIEYNRRYCLSGTRSGKGPTDLNISIQKKDIWASLGNLGIEDIHVDSNGHYEVSIVSSTSNGASSTPNLLRVPPEECVLIIRQTLSDWEPSQPDSLKIELLDQQPEPSQRGHDDLYSELIKRLEGVIHHNVSVLQDPIFALPPNTISAPSGIGEKSGYLQTQKNALGHVKIAPNQVLAVRASSAGAGYYALAVTDVWGVSLDADKHFNSINNLQLRPGNPDEFVFLLSHTPLPYQNWIDLAGLPQSIAMLRWQLLRQKPALPTVSSQVIDIGEVEKLYARYLVPVSQEDQKLLFEQRRKGYYKRFARANW